MTSIQKKQKNSHNRFRYDHNDRVWYDYDAIKECHDIDDNHINDKNKAIKNKNEEIKDEKD